MVDTFGQLLALKEAEAHEKDRTGVKGLAGAVQATTGGNVWVTYEEQGYTGEQRAADTGAEGVRLEVVKCTKAKRGFVLLPKPG